MSKWFYILCKTMIRANRVINHRVPSSDRVFLYRLLDSCSSCSVRSCGLRFSRDNELTRMPRSVARVLLGISLSILSFPIACCQLIVTRDQTFLFVPRRLWQYRFYVHTFPIAQNCTFFTTNSVETQFQMLHSKVFIQTFFFV